MKFRLNCFHSLSGKFILGIILILIFMLAGTLFATSQFMQRYYLHQQKNYVKQIGMELKKEINSGSLPQNAIETIEKKERVLIVYLKENQNQNDLNDELREAFRQKGLGFQKFWLWEQDYMTALEDGFQFRLYNQSKLNYSILVQYLSMDSNLYAIAAIVPNAAGFIQIMNRFSFLLYTLSIFISMILIVTLIKHITNPLTQIAAFTKKLSSHQYEPLEIKTGDELEEVAKSLNEMGYEIKQYQKMLESKSEQMKQLLDDVAHDLKTPISLVGMYTSGMKDGLDDGTFLDIIIQQNNKISHIVERLLHLSHIEQSTFCDTDLQLDQLLISCIEEQRILFEQRNLELQNQINPHITLKGNKEFILELFSNLLSNAAKYASSGLVEIKLYQNQKNILFYISNQTDNTNLDIAHIFQPFYVGENSRNPSLSGTGLGLSIVKKIADQFGYSVLCKLKKGQISFEITFPIL